MATLTVFISRVGTPLADGGSSAVGHMYFSVSSEGNTYSYGFAPAEHGKMFGAGAVSINDTENYTEYYKRWDFPVSQSQFDNIRTWAEDTRKNGTYGDYNGLFNNCVTYTYEAMTKAGFNPAEGHMMNLPTWNSYELDSLYYGYLRRPEFNKEFQKTPTLDRSLNDLFKKALSWVRPKDPLVLDLDGDGIEATAIDTSNPVLFDHDADGIKSATGWIKSDDGIVALDLNGNGAIDSGRELFGDNTLLANGATATNGFQAIARYDTNQDGKINAADPIFTQLRIWQDANQDGISQASELKSLSAAGIASINVNRPGFSGGSNL